MLKRLLIITILWTSISSMAIAQVSYEYSYLMMEASGATTLYSAKSVDRLKKQKDLNPRQHLMLELDRLSEEGWEPIDSGSFMSGRFLLILRRQKQ
ncbi:MAG: hypothetical protein M3R08_09645 [Bacteroidota bacterium]|nr:hypothetical protein [Bacteroidota bacterium]